MQRWHTSGWWIKSGTASHVFMGAHAGKMRVPAAEYAAFLEQVAECAEQYALVELKAPRFPMFVDMDYKRADISVEQWWLHALALAEVLQELGAGEQRVLIASYARPEQGCRAHFYVPGIHVNCRTAAKVRDAFVVRLQARYADEADWADVVDRRMYGGTGMRMMYTCKDAPDDRCYVPRAWAALGQASALDAEAWQGSRLDALTLTSLRLHSTRREFNVNATLAREIIDASTPAATAESADAANVSLRALSMLLLHRFKIRKARPQLVRRHATLWLINVDSRLCANVDREHRRARVYFIASPQGLAQKCYCRCESTGCERYTSRFEPLTEKLRAELFPELPTVCQPRFLPAPGTASLAELRALAFPDDNANKRKHT